MSKAGECMVTVGAVISVAHRPKGGGPLHGHDYEILASFREGPDMVKAAALLNGVLAEIDHTELPDSLSRAEDMGRWIGARLPGCVIVEVNRPWLRKNVCVRL